MSKLIVRPPSPLLAEGIVTHIDRQPIDVDSARRQWEAYVDAFADEGWEIHLVEPAPECPDSVFIEDALVVHGDRAVATRPGAQSRLPEVPGAARTAAHLGLSVATITGPATLDGGDVLRVGGRFFVGVGARTTLSGAEQLGDLLDVPVVPVHASKVLHLKSAVTALPDGTVIGLPELVDDPGVFDRFAPVPEEPGSHVVVLDEESVLMASSAPRTIMQLREAGLRVVSVDISEYEKLEGCVTCLSVRVRGL